jgi:hypothetical protein
MSAPAPPRGAGRPDGEVRVGEAGVGAAGAGDAAADEARADEARVEDACRFARVLALATRAALAAAVLVFVLVALGALPMRVPLAELPAHWSRDAQAWRQMLAATTDGWPVLAGWPWPARSPGELAGLLAIGALCIAPVPALALLAMRLARRRDRVFAALAVAHIVVIVLTLGAIFI